jgi:hypothetical protein
MLRCDKHRVALRKVRAGGKLVWRCPSLTSRRMSQNIHQRSTATLVVPTTHEMPIIVVKAAKRGRGWNIKRLTLRLMWRSYSLLSHQRSTAITARRIIQATRITDVRGERLSYLIIIGSVIRMNAAMQPSRKPPKVPQERVTIERVLRR